MEKYFFKKNNKNYYIKIDIKNKNNKDQTLFHKNSIAFNYINNIMMNNKLKFKNNIYLLLLIIYFFFLNFQISLSNKIKLRKLNFFESEIILTIRGNGTQPIFSNFFIFSYINNTNDINFINDTNITNNINYTDNINYTNNINIPNDINDNNNTNETNNIFDTYNNSDINDTNINDNHGSNDIYNINNSWQINYINEANETNEINITNDINDNTIDANDNGHINNTYNSYDSNKNNEFNDTNNENDKININFPFNIYVNGIFQNYTDKYVYNLTKLENIIKIIWNYQLVNCKSMFEGLYNIININLSKFDSSKVTDMSNMFKGCYYLSSLDLNNLNTSKVTNMSQIFYDCNSLPFLDLNSLDTSFVKDMYGMFAYCYNLKELSIDNFNTLNVRDMEGMFYYCNSLLSLNLSNFNTSSVIWMDFMFYGCSQLISLDLSNFETGKVVDMSFMFKNCYSLISLNLNNFNTSSVINMESIFESCESLTRLNLISFFTPNVINMNGMFCFCYSLISLNINNFNMSKVEDMAYMFYYCKSLIYLNISHFKVYNNIYYHSTFRYLRETIILCINNEIKNNFNFYSYKYNCSDICFTNLEHKIIREKYKCIDKCINDNVYKYEYEGICYKSCPPRTNIFNNNTYLCKNFTCEKYYNYEQTGCIENISEGYYLNNSFFKTIDKCNKKCKSCNLESAKNSKCLSCNIARGYYPILDNGLNISQYSFINCTNNTPYGYFFENETYKPCYSTCKECNEIGDKKNNKCITCKSKYRQLEQFNNDSNCYYDCNPFYFYNYDLYNYFYSYYYYYFDSNGDYLCSERNKCPKDYKLIFERNKCIDNCTKDIIYKYEYNNYCYESCPMHTHISADNNFLCEEDIKCPNYYNFTHTGCLEYIPEGYFLNSSQLKTIDKCHIDCKTCKQKETKNNTNCDSCKNSKYVDLGNCVTNCSYGYFNDSNNLICKCSSNIKCFKCSIESNNYKLCISCNEEDGYYPKYEDNSNIYNFIDCYKNPEGYFLKNGYYYECYSTCKFCLGEGNEINHNCSQCKENYTFINEIQYNNVCFPTCNFYYYFDRWNDYKCTEEKNCPDIYNKLIQEKNKCIDNCEKDDIYKYEFDNKCYKKCPEGTIYNNYLCEIKNNIITSDTINSKYDESNNIKTDILSIENNIYKNKEDSIIKNIRNEFQSGTLDLYVSNFIDGDKNDLVIEEDNIVLQITTTDNQKKNTKINISTIDLGECENILKKHYNISKMRL